MTRFMPLFLCFLLFTPATAKADYFVWQDPDTGLTMTFPDTWKVQSNEQPDDLLTIAGPAADNTHPLCRVRAREDRRAVIYPNEFGRPVQKKFVSTPFWQDYMGEYDNYNLGQVYDYGGLGRGFASYTTASFVKRDGSVYQSRSGILFASLYYDKMYIVDCSSLVQGFARWVNPFRSIVKSIDFKKAFHEKPYGDYANFLGQADRYFWAQTDPVGTVGY